MLGRSSTPKLFGCYNSSPIDEFDGIPEIKDHQMQGWLNVRLNEMIKDLERNQTVLFDRVGALEEFLPRRMPPPRSKTKLRLRQIFSSVIACLDSRW
jgi:hypothetical protein